MKIKGLLLIVGMLCLSLLLGKFYFKKDAAGTNFTPYIVKEGNLNIEVLSTGIIQPENKVEIKPPIAGRIEKVLISEGVRVQKGHILAWMSSTERAAMLDAARAKGALEVKEWEELYRATPILAPITGTIIQKNVETGQTFTTQDAILVMSDRLTVKAQVDETDIAGIKLKQKTSITLDAYPTILLEGEVDQIAFDAKTVNNVTTYIVDVLPKNPPEFMRSGMTANVRFHIQSKKNILVIPTEAIKILSGKSTVLLSDKSSKDSQAVELEVSTGLSDGKLTEILEGVHLGDTLLIPSFKTGLKKSSSLSPFGSGGGGRGRGGH